MATGIGGDTGRKTGSTIEPIIKIVPGGLLFFNNPRTMKGLLNQFHDATSYNTIRMNFARHGKLCKPSSFSGWFIPLGEIKELKRPLNEL